MDGVLSKNYTPNFRFAEVRQEWERVEVIFGNVKEAKRSNYVEIITFGRKAFTLLIFLVWRLFFVEEAIG